MNDNSIEGTIMAGLCIHLGHTTGSIFGTSAVTHSSQCQNPQQSLPPTFIQPRSLNCCLSHLATPSPLSPGWWRLSLARLPSPLPRGLNPIPFAHSTGVNHHHENKRKHTSKGGKVFLWLYTHPLDPGSRCSPWSSFPAGLTSLLPFLPPSRQMPILGGPNSLSLFMEGSSLVAQPCCLACSSPSQPGHFSTPI